jgi:glycolate oxidase FAD binding subunit
MTVAQGLDPRSFAIGAHVPRAAYAPDSVAALAALLRSCDADGRAIVFFGGGTLQALGHPPARYDVAISLTRLARVLEHEHRDLTVAVEAGITVAALDATLAAQGRYVPLDAPRAAQATVGGTLASGWLGPRRAAHGRARDLVIGTTLVLADGTIAKAGGMVVKNVSGYDLSKLYVGSLGTLGAIVRANFKTLPLPAARRVAIATLPEGTRARAIANIAALAIEPVAALAIAGFAGEIDGRDGLEGRLLMLFEGSPRTIERATRELRSALGAAGVPETRLIDRDAGAAFERVVDAYVAPCGAASVTYRSPGLPGDTGPRLDAFARVARFCELDVETLEDVRTGDVIARLSTAGADFPARIAAFDAERRTALATARVIAASSALDARLDAWGAPPSNLAAMQAVKRRFDPKGTLAPGRYVGGM